MKRTHTLSFFLVLNACGLNACATRVSIVTSLTIVIKVQTLCKVDAYPANTIDIINSGHMSASTNGSLVLTTIHLATIFDIKQVPNQFVSRRLN